MGASHSNKPIIAVVGGIGAGKSTVARMFGELGCAVIDADAIGHELLDDPDVRRELHDRWGAEVFHDDGAVNRRALADIVFADARELAFLDAILHPRIRRRMELAVADAVAGPDVPGVVLDAAVLFEAGWDDLCTDIVFVDSDEGDRAARVNAARGWDARTWRRRENSQISLDLKRAKCDHVLHNRSGESHLNHRVRELFRRIVRDADRP